jgi:glycosyltransferase involved in cell wall biosynthesis
MSVMSSPQATVLITTKDRKDVLGRAIDSVYAQSVPLELLVVDDGSTDGTSEFVRERYPQAVLVRNGRPLGIIAVRNQAAQLASTNILFTLDDDAAFATGDVAETVIGNFDDARVGAVAIPHINHLPDRQVWLRNVPGRADEDFPVVFDYAGGANAMRLDLFLALGGYSGTGRQGEENTYCLKLISSGYVVRVAASGHIDHYPPPQHRDRAHVVRMGCQNGVDFIWRNVPMPWLVPHLAANMASQLMLGLRQGEALYRLQGLIAGVRHSAANFSARRPVSISVYQLMRRLIARGSMKISEVEPLLPPRKTKLAEDASYVAAGT